MAMFLSSLHEDLKRFLIRVDPFQPTLSHNNSCKLPQTDFRFVQYSMNTFYTRDLNHCNYVSQMNYLGLLIVYLSEIAFILT